MALVPGQLGLEMGAPGCDDAPVVGLSRDAKLRPLTLVLPYYENPRFLRRQVEHLNALPEDLRSHLTLIVVDDCSPQSPASGVLATMDSKLAGLLLYRVMKDVRWNWIAARNIGAHHAAPGWLLLTDMDHLVPEDTMRAAMSADLHDDHIYRFSRTERGAHEIHPHPNSWLMTRDMFWKVGGYDEACSGYYGTDGDYRRRCAATAPILILAEPLDRHEHDGDSSTTHYKRKQPEDARVKEMIRARGPGWKPKALSFPYREVAL